MSEEEEDKGEDHYIAELNIDVDSLPVTNVEMQHERRVAIFDLLEGNVFRPLESEKGPYLVDLSLQDGQRLVFNVKLTTGADIGKYTLSMTPFRRIVKDYFMICESYHNAIRTATSAQIEAIDICLLYTSPSPRDATLSRMPSSA